jgi:hypothetical protein
MSDTCLRDLRAREAEEALLANETNDDDERLFHLHLAEQYGSILLCLERIAQERATHRCIAVN